MGQAQLPPQRPVNSTFAKNLGRVGIGLAIALTASSLGAFWYGRYFLNEQLSPLLQVELGKALKRPLQLGKVERVGLSSIRFGRSLVPPTDKEANFLAVEALEVKVDLWSYATSRQIGLDAIAEQPQIFLKQDVTGLIVLPKITPPEKQTKEGFVDLRTVTFNDAQLTIQTIAKGELVSLSQIQIDSNWKIADLNNQSLKMNGKGRVTLPNLRAIAVPPNPEQLKKAIETANTEKDSNKGNISFGVDWDLTKGQGHIDIQSQELQIAALQGFAVNLPVEIQQGKLDTGIKVDIIAGKETPTLSITAKLSDGAIKSPQLTKPITEIAGQFGFDGTTATLKDTSARFDFFKVSVDGSFSQSKGFDLNFASSSLDLAKGITSFKLKVPIAIAGELKLDGKFTGTPQKPDLTVNLTAAKPLSFDRLTFDQFLANVELKDLNALQIKKLEASSLGAKISGSGQIKLPQKDTPAEILFTSNFAGVAENFANVYSTKLPIAIGQVTSSVQITGNLTNPQILAQIEAPNAIYPAKGEVLLADGLATIRNAKVKFPIGEVSLGGTYNLASGAWKTQLNSNGIPLAALLKKKKGLLQGLINLRSDRGGFGLADIIGDATLQLPDGVSELPDAITTNLVWDGKNLLIPSLQVGNYLTAKGKLDLAFANNSSQIPTGIAGINLDLNSQNVNINRFASLSSVISPQASGILNFQGNLSGAIDKLKIAGALRLDNVAVASFGSVLAKQGLVVPSRGLLDFNGLINGDLTAPKLAGKLRLANFKLNQLELDNLTFDGIWEGIGKNLQMNGDLLLAGLTIDKLDKNAINSRLEGKVNFEASQGLNLDLRGNRDRLVAHLDRNFHPIDFNLSLGEANASGKRLASNPNLLHIEIANLPLPLIASLAGQTDVSGKVSSKLDLNFTNDQSAIGELAIDRPRFGRFVANRVLSKFTYAKGILDIKDGDLNVRQEDFNNDYKFNVTFNPNVADPIVGTVEIVQGRMQDIFATLQWVNIADANQVFNLTKTGAANLQPIESIDLINQTLYKQLQYLTQIEARQDQQETANSSRNFNLPPLTDFRGEIKGKITFGLNKIRGVRLGVNLVGKNFEYGKFAIDDINLEGRYFNSGFVIKKAIFQSDKSSAQITNARIRLAPSANPLLRVREQSGEIELKNFPIESLRSLPFYTALPFAMTGKVNGNLSITGTNVFDTKIVGKLNLIDGTFNRQAIEFIAIKFTYDKLNIKFDTNITAAGKDAVVASGDIGIFGFFNVKLDVTNEGLSLINIFSQQPLRWINGKGNINITASGTLKEPKIAGQVNVDNAKVAIAGLPGDFTEVQGKINFTNDRLTSDITSNFSEGKLAIKGILPLSDNRLLKQDSPEYQQALAINADKLKVNFRDISSDNFNSRVIVRGSLLQPRITGEVSLGDGRIVIGNNADSSSTNSTQSNNDIDLAFDKLAVKLQNMQVTRFPIFNFLGEGSLIVGGKLLKPEPDGRINITRGQFNAVSTRFRLDRAYDNFVEFKPSQGLNPILSVHVAGSVAEVTRVPISANRPNDLFSPNEIPVSNLGAQGTLQVQGSVTGTALVPDIRLSSSPPRTQAEILALIGGGILQQQGGSDPSSALASFAGGTILNYLQDAIGDALSLAEFNLSPVTTNTEGSRTGSLGLSAEMAIDISNSFSLALQRIINDSTQPTNFSVRYRLDPSILLRSNYGSNGNTGISIEYQNRF